MTLYRRNPGRLEFVDQVTGRPARRQDSGAAPSGRFITRVRPSKKKPLVTLPIPSTVLSSEAGSFPYSSKLRPSLQKAAKERAKAEGKELRKKPWDGVVRIPGELRSYRSAEDAARIFMEGNQMFFNGIQDATDPLREWKRTFDVKVGKRVRKLADTPKGAQITSVAGALKYLFGRNRSRRWSEVEWDEVDRLMDMLGERHVLRERLGSEAEVGYFEAGDAVVTEAYWKPVYAYGELSEATIDFDTLMGLRPDIAHEVRVQLAAHSDLSEEGLLELENAYRAVKKQLSPRDRRVIERRIATFREWAQYPRRIPTWALTPDERTRGYTYRIPSLAMQTERLLAVPDEGYEPNWPIEERRVALADGRDPDTIGLPPVEPASVPLDELIRPSLDVTEDPFAIERGESRLTQEPFDETDPGYPMEVNPRITASQLRQGMRIRIDGNIRTVSAVRTSMGKMVVSLRKETDPKPLPAKQVALSPGSHVPVIAMDTRSGGKLGGAHYTLRNARSRRMILKDCVDAYGARSCRAALAVLERQPKIDDKTRKLVKSDIGWMGKNYGRAINPDLSEPFDAQVVEAAVCECGSLYGVQMQRNPEVPVLRNGRIESAAFSAVGSLVGSIAGGLVGTALGGAVGGVLGAVPGAFIGSTAGSAYGAYRGAKYGATTGTGIATSPRDAAVYGAIGGGILGFPGAALGAFVGAGEDKPGKAATNPAKRRLMR